MVCIHNLVMAPWYAFFKALGASGRGSPLTLFICDCYEVTQLPFKEGSERRTFIGLSGEGFKYPIFCLMMILLSFMRPLRIK